MSPRLRLAALATALLCALAGAQDLTTLLSTDDLAALPPQARARFDAAAASLDHADQDGALHHLVTASEMAPDQTALQLLTATIAMERVDSLRGLEALEALTWAEQCYSRVLLLPEADPSALRRAQRGMDQIVPTAEAIGAREDLVREASDAVIAHLGAVQEQVARADEARRRLRRAQQETTAQSDNSGSNPLLLTSDETERLYDSSGSQSLSEQGALPDSDYSRNLR